MQLMYSEGEDCALKRLRRKIKKKQAENTVTESGNIHWMVFQSNNSLFTGRTKLIARILTAFRDDTITDTAEQRFVITDMGGQGKGEICIKVASLMREECVVSSGLLSIS
jgi:hypothetical protein